MEKEDQAPKKGISVLFSLTTHGLISKIQNDIDVQKTYKRTHEGAKEKKRKKSKVIKENNLHDVKLQKALPFPKEKLFFTP